MEENPQAPEEQEVGEDPQEKASDARKEAFIEEFIRAHEELLLAENSFFKRLAPAGFLLDAVLFFYATLVVFNTIHTLASRPQIPIGSLLMSVAYIPFDVSRSIRNLGVLAFFHTPTAFLRRRKPVDDAKGRVVRGLQAVRPRSSDGSRACPTWSQQGSFSSCDVAIEPRGFPHATLSIDLLCVGPGCIFRLAS